MENAERKRLAAKLHYAHEHVITAKKGGYRNYATLHSELADASNLIKQVIDELMDATGMTDYYGNPTAREDS